MPIDRPGLGVEVDRNRIEDLTVRVETVGLEPASRASGRTVDAQATGP